MGSEIEIRSEIEIGNKIRQGMTPRNFKSINRREVLTYITFAA